MLYYSIAFGALSFVCVALICATLACAANDARHAYAFHVAKHSRRARYQKRKILTVKQYERRMLARVVLHHVQEFRAHYACAASSIACVAALVLLLPIR